MHINNPFSPVAQDFIWMAEYADGTHFSEFDMETKVENSFYSIDKQKLIRFGVIGHGQKFYYEVFGGIWKLAGQMVELIYKEGDKEYPLTGRDLIYNDIITYKDAENLVNLVNGGVSKTQITQFNVGYKIQFTCQGVMFYLQTICKVPYGQPTYLNIRLVADKTIKGTLVLRKNGIVSQEFPAPLVRNVAGELNWVVK